MTASLPPVQLVIFDMAGTTVTDKHEVEACFARAAQATGLIVSPEKIRALQGYSKIKVFNLLWQEQLGPHHPNLNSSIQHSYQRFCQILEEHYLTQPVTPTEGCLQTFEQLKKANVKIALTTGFYRKVTNIILERLGWLAGLNDEYVNQSGNCAIDCSITSDDVRNGRPEPDMIFRAMHLLQVTNPKSVVSVGDTPSDLIAGRKAGCKYAFGVLNGTHTAAQLAAYENDGLFGSIAELPTRILN
jgi:phosphonatase-like hydrolase